MAWLSWFAPSRGLFSKTLRHIIIALLEERSNVKKFKPAVIVWNWKQTRICICLLIVGKNELFLSSSQFLVKIFNLPHIFLRGVRVLDCNSILSDRVSNFESANHHKLSTYVHTILPYSFTTIFVFMFIRSKKIAVFVTTFTKSNFYNIIIWLGLFFLCLLGENYNLSKTKRPIIWI